MTTHPIVSRSEWLEARRELLAEEKAMSRQLDALAARRRALPWVRVDEPYAFETTAGTKTLAELFGEHSQLLVYHFMYGPDWEQGCPSCSFWADNFDGVDCHLAARDISLVAVSRAPLAKLQAYRERMGWRFEWVSSSGSSFNYDFWVSFTPEQREQEFLDYNFGKSKFPSSEAPGMSAFIKQDGQVFHSYSAHARGIDILNGAYQWMDMSPRGRDEDRPMSWLRRHDQY